MFKTLKLYLSLCIACVHVCAYPQVLKKARAAVQERFQSLKEEVKKGGIIASSGREGSYKDPIFRGYGERWVKHKFRTIKAGAQKPLENFAKQFGVNYTPLDEGILDLTNEEITDVSQIESVLKTTLKYDLMAKVAPDGSEYYPAVHWLRLGRNKLTTLPPRAFEKFPNLRGIDLGGNDITTIHHRAFDGLKDLSVVILSDNKITKFSKAAFAQTRDIAGNPIAGSKVKLVLVGNNPLPSEAVEVLRAAGIPCYKIGMDRHFLTRIIKVAGIIVAIEIIILAAVFVFYAITGVAAPAVAAAPVVASGPAMAAAPAVASGPMVVTASQTGTIITIGKTTYVVAAGVNLYAALGVLAII